jgi:hypothetical protein
MAGEIRYLERVDLSGAALTVENAFPGRLDATAKRRNHAQAGDDNTPHIQHSRRWMVADQQQEAGGPCDHDPSGFIDTPKVC